MRSKNMPDDAEIIHTYDALEAEVRRAEEERRLENEQALRVAAIGEEDEDTTEEVE